MKEVSAEMDATMKDGSHRKFTLCQYCVMELMLMDVNFGIKAQD